MSNQSAHADAFIPRLIAGLSVLAVVLVLGIVWLLCSALIESRRSAQRHRRVQELCGTIMHIDEVLTMSAKMCAATGNMRWKQRYDDHVKKLDRSIQEAEVLIPLSEPQTSEEISAVNDRLVAMEQQAFRLAAQGLRQEAMALLESGQYQLDKQKYSKATQDRVDAMLQDVQASLSKERWQSRSTIAGAIVVLCLILGSCSISLTVMRQHLTRRKRTEQEQERLIADLANKNAELERFTYTVSHDLKGPLITIIGHLGVLKEDIAANDAEQINEDLTWISDAAHKMHRLLTELLEMSRIGRLTNPPESVALADLTHEAVESISGQFPQPGVRIDVAADLPVLRGDRTRLREVMQNLIENAIKYMGDQPQPRVEIGVRQDGQETVCYVRDNGLGIEPRYHDRIFGLFEKLDQQTEGTGVGLALVKRIVEVHGGRIWVESDGAGQGSTFCFTLS